MFQDFVSKTRQFHHDDRGDVVQVGILTAIFAVMAIGAYVYLAPKVKGLFDKAGSELDKGKSFTY